MEKVKKYRTQLNKVSLWEMSNISPRRTGLDRMIWFQYFTGKEGHWARVKIEIDNELIPITISDNPEIKIKDLRILKKISAASLNKVKKFIVLNKTVLLKYWNASGKMSIDELLDEIQKI
jgi:hypothetical protein